MSSRARSAFLRALRALPALLVLLAPSSTVEGQAQPSLDDRIRGLLIGSFVGDALGGPIEFQPPEKVHALKDAPKVWRDDEVLDADARAATVKRLRLRSYKDLRPQPESYGQWNIDSEPGTITDDSRHKLVLLHSFRVVEKANRWPFDVGDLAQAFLDWPLTSAVTDRPEYVALAADWLEEWQLGARWILGERDLKLARPPERMWNGVPTCCGQMSLPPLAALFAGDPDRAYRAAYRLAFFDNGFGKDMNAALVAGLAAALTTSVELNSPGRAWDAVLSAVRKTDPYGHAKIRWSERPVDRWMNLALKLAKDSGGRPARLFAALEQEFLTTTKWEAQVPFVVDFACLAIADYDPLVALQLTMEWGHDSDSYAQLLGAFIGALHGAEIFPAEIRDPVERRLLADHKVEIEAECRLLIRLNKLGKTKTIVRYD